uniref:SH2 domain-containing protein n=1 Tax=Varanus komodoensis TaxID=61221 RepID=A0A8D2J393_VARKO
EMVLTDATLEDGPNSLDPEKMYGVDNLEKAMGEVCPEQKGSKNLARDSGYDSLPSKLSILDKLLHTHPVWLQLGLDDAEAADVLRPHPPGTFLVRKSSRMQKKVLSLRLPSEFGSCLKEFAIKESTYTFSLEGSGISFADLFRLIAFYCISRDVLPFTLKLPHAIASATTEAELEQVLQLGPSKCACRAGRADLAPSLRRAAETVAPPEGATVSGLALLRGAEMARAPRAGQGRPSGVLERLCERPHCGALRAVSFPKSALRCEGGLQGRGWAPPGSAFLLVGGLVADARGPGPAQGSLAVGVLFFLVAALVPAAGEPLMGERFACLSFLGSVAHSRWLS